jgi:diguanylate cyclase (GGDEF)-like protein
MGEKEQLHLFHLATRDWLTGLYVIRHFRTAMNQAIREARARNSPLSLILIDIDHFKKINDTYGHQAGDQVLRETAQIIQAHVRQKRNPQDVDLVAARYGGEEFIVMLRNCDLTNATVKVAERLRKAVEEATFRWGQSVMPVTVSVGVSTLHPEETTLESMIQRADQALYQAKAQGRNRTCVEQQPKVRDSKREE